MQVADGERGNAAKGKAQIAALAMRNSYKYPTFIQFQR